MRFEEVQKLFRTMPFEPFAIHLSDGSTYEVRRPDQVLLTPRAVYVGVQNGRHERVFQDIVICDLVHVTRLAPVRRARRRTGR